jgi:hypothetical protein
MVATPLDGRITSLSLLTGTLTGTEVMYIVSPGNAQFGNSFQVTINLLAGFFGSFPTLNPTLIKSGASYASVPTDFRILVDLTVAGALAITMLPSAQYTQPILIKDIAGNLSNVNATTITFSSAQTADGATSIVMQTPYEGIWLNPLAAGGFYVTAA